LSSRSSHSASAAISRTNRSRVSNGSSLFLETVDQRSAEARRFRDILGEIVGDLGGADRLSEGQRQMARRCALLSTECERMEAKAVAGEEIDLDVFGQLTDRLGRAFQRLGLKRVKRDVTPVGYRSVDEYKARKAAERTGEAV
jgi:hypothetical protein